MDPQAPLPRISPGAYAVLSNWENPGDGVNSSLTHSFAGQLTKLQGNHAMKFGAECRVHRSFNNRRPTGVAPDFSFNTTYTRGPLDNSPAATIGQDLASLLFGIPAGSMEVSASSAPQDQFLALYWQDDVKLTPKLTVNLGLRWEYETPLNERYDRLVASFDFNASNPIEALARANYAARPIPELPPADFRVRGALQWVQQGGVGRSPFRGEKFNLMPRIGWAYQLDSKTVLRSGYGIFYNPIGIHTTLPVQTGFSQSTPIQASLDNGRTYLATTANPFPNGLRQPLGPSGGLTTNLGLGIEFHNYNRKNPDAQRWTLGLQRMLPADFVLETSYVGNPAWRLSASSTTSRRST